MEQKLRMTNEGFELARIQARDARNKFNEVRERR
jgi:hypothetical protein